MASPACPGSPVRRGIRPQHRRHPLPPVTRSQRSSGALGDAHTTAVRHADWHLTVRLMVTTERSDLLVAGVRPASPYSLSPWSGRAGCAVRGLGHCVGRPWGWVMVKVYVSSTVADLRQERQAVMD